MARLGGQKREGREDSRKSRKTRWSEATQEHCPKHPQAHVGGNKQLPGSPTCGVCCLVLSASHVASRS